MFFPLYIAKRYLFAKKKSIVNIISAISALGVIVGTTALILTLSVYNGLNGLISSLISTTDSDLKIEALSSKSYSLNQEVIESIEALPNVVTLHQIIEEKALIRYNNRQIVATVKGADSIYFDKISPYLIAGSINTELDGSDQLIVGNAIAYALRLSPESISPLYIYFPKRGVSLKSTSFSSLSALKTSYAYCGGVFSIQQETDITYIFSSLNFARELFQMDDRVSSIEVILNSSDPNSVAQTKEEIESIIGDRYRVKNRAEQHETLYKLLKSEKLIGYLILIFILIISSFNIVSTLSMLILDKRKDISILYSMGTSKKMVRQIFLVEGIMISCIGATIGVVLGLIISKLQQHFGFLKLSGESYITDQYPIEIVTSDVLISYIIVLIIGFFAAYIPTRLIKSL